MAPANWPAPENSSTKSRSRWSPYRSKTKDTASSKAGAAPNEARRAWRPTRGMPQLQWRAHCKPNRHLTATLQNTSTERDITRIALASSVNSKREFRNESHATNDTPTDTCLRGTSVCARRRLHVSSHCMVQTPQDTSTSKLPAA